MAVDCSGQFWTVLDNFGQYYGTGKLPQIAVDCGYVMRGSYKTSSGAALLLLSFLQLWILVYRQSNRTGLRDPLAVLVPRLTESLTPTLELTLEPSRPSTFLAPQQLPFTIVSTPQILSTTQLSSEVTKLLFIDPIPRSEPQITVGSLLGGKRRSGREKRPTAKKKDMLNQDL